MTQKDLFPTTIFSQQATPASPSLSPGSKKAQKMTATSGRTSLELLHKKDRLGAFSRMFMVTSPWASTRCCLTWKAKATPQGRLLFQLAASTLPTDEIDYGSSPTVNWPTPSASDVEGGTAQDVKLENNRFSRKNKDGVRWGVKLRDAVNHTEKMWATPNTMDHLPPRSEESTKKMQEGHRKGRARPSNLREQVDEKTMSMWPTPLARDYKGGRKAETLAAAGRNETNSLPDAVNSQMGKTGSLNPTWVEWLMGYPEGWTDLKD